MIALAALRTGPRLQGGVQFSGEFNHGFSATWHAAIMHQKSASEKPNDISGPSLMHIS
jgi:hypothetical protein